jgi:purine nucleoside phosphorylase
LEINFRANIDTFKRAEATNVIFVVAKGYLRNDLLLKLFVIIDQHIGRTFARVKGFELATLRIC